MCKSVVTQLVTGISRLSRLRHFSMKHTCNAREILVVQNLFLELQFLRFDLLLMLISAWNIVWAKVHWSGNCFSMTGLKVHVSYQSLHWLYIRKFSLHYGKFEKTLHQFTNSFQGFEEWAFSIRVLESLAGSGCATVLTYLDVESSPHVDDACLDFITRFNHVEV